MNLKLLIMNIRMTTLGGVFLFCIFCFQACAQSKPEKKDPRNITPQYTGEIDKQDMAHSPYTSRWFDVIYNSYDPNAEKEAIQKIKENINDYEIISFMGTWCPDSKREIPRLYKILEEADYNVDRMEMYTLDYSKHSAKQFEKEWQIFRVPTIIFLKDGKEVNRFVERPRQSLIQDVARIVSGEPYKNIYQR